MFIDKKFRKPRVWSNKILLEISHMFTGDVANISGWQDKDKQGRYYKDYFSNAENYVISNYESNARGFQGNIENEFFLNLEDDLPKKLIKKFDVVFNHTVLEHIFDIQKAFQNLCLLSKDIVIVVVPFLQEQHGDYGDYWRFTPLAIKKLFEKNDMKTIYINYNDSSNESIYVLAIGSSNPEKWNSIYKFESNQINQTGDIGTKILKNSLITKVLYKFGLIN
jgi:hypothetical protein